MIQPVPAVQKKILTPLQRRVLMASPAGWIASGLGSGLTPWAQGTFGSAAAIIPWLALRHLPWPLYALVVGLTFALGVWACDVAGRALGIDDHRSLVIDEFVGQWIALWPIVAVASWQGVLLGFVLFRLFDVWKPWPIRWLDRHLKGGMGVMVDDLVAGVFAALAAAAALYACGVALASP
ncbi:phosphatidylglycerophosphatase A family protein [Dyella sp.]|jgi:phosphatidylglycerophosphatase A|uniref:phosphatidylglycerophosphatase A family protein n=1 Tax=Dyella sp. TaxID=1869338 RepID=UPI002D79E0CE|nr:phosphatidylglycerophosphatase A [Dyella sp.]HET6433275.1 phosphatidylglycerophosphatase A [Dyella sp.]